MPLSDLLRSGVLIPIRLHPFSFMPGRHGLKRSGDGMRLLRTRPFIAGEDNPRDIDKFSPSDDPWIHEREAEAQAHIVLLVDMSPSMRFPAKARLRNIAVLQLTYSLWRSGDRMETVLFGCGPEVKIRERNLQAQFAKLSSALQQSVAPQRGTKVIPLPKARDRQDLIFVVSDFLEQEFVVRAKPSRVIPVMITFQLSQDLAGLMKIWDPERNRKRLMWFSPARIAAINRREKARVDRQAAVFRRMGCDHLTLLHPWEVYPQLAGLARIRRQRRLA